MTMHYSPDTVFRPKDARNPESNWGGILTSANLGLKSFDLHDVCKVGSHILRYIVKCDDLAIPVMRCSTLHRLSSLLPSAHRRAKGVRQAYVISMRVETLQRLGISLRELTQGNVRLFNHLVKI